MQFEFEDLGMVFKEGMNGSPYDALAFTVNERHFINASISACFKILTYNRGRVFRIESMEVKDSVDRDVD